MTKFGAALYLLKPIGLLLIITLLVIEYSCSDDTGPPEINLTAFPTVGDTTIVFEFNGSKTRDDNTKLEGLFFRWDFQSNGVWDTDYGHNPVSIKRYDLSGRHKVTCEVMDCDGNVSSSFIEIYVLTTNPFVDTLIDFRDHQAYRIVKINEDWWMADNLNFGRWLPSEVEQVDNQIPEKYYLDDDSLHNSKIGSLYLWQEALNYSFGPGIKQGLCPSGWHIPSLSDWNKLLKNMDLWYAWNYFGKEGFSGLNINIGAAANRKFDKMNWEPQDHFFWSSDYQRLEFLNEAAPWVFYWGETWGNIGVRYLHVYYDGSDGLWSIGSNYASIRCIKDS